MSEKTSISDTEKEIMEILWQSSPISASQITHAIQQQRDMHPNTVKTLLNRLVKKDVISYTEQGRRFLYSPLVAKDAFYNSQTTRFLDQFFNGRISSLVSHFAKNDRLTPEEIEQIKTLIDTMEQDNE